MGNHFVELKMIEEKKNSKILLATRCLTKAYLVKLSIEKKKKKKKKKRYFLQWWVNRIIDLIIDVKTDTKILNDELTDIEILK